MFPFLLRSPERPAGLRRGIRFWRVDEMQRSTSLMCDSLVAIACAILVFYALWLILRTRRRLPALQRSLTASTWSGRSIYHKNVTITHEQISASEDNIRLWNVLETPVEGWKRKGLPPFRVIPGHHGGLVSQMCR